MKDHHEALKHLAKRRQNRAKLNGFAYCLKHNKWVKGKCHLCATNAKRAFSIANGIAARRIP
jgi:hypothetical protein